MGGLNSRRTVSLRNHHNWRCMSLGLKDAAKNFMQGQLRDLISAMSTDKHRSGLERAAIIKAFQEMSDELGRRGITGELCLFGGEQSLVENLFAEGKI